MFSFVCGFLASMSLLILVIPIYLLKQAFRFVSD